MQTLLLGFHDFLNAQPLLATLREHQGEANYKLCLDSPAGIASKMKTGQLDLAMMPTVSYLKNRSQYILMNHFAIVSRGPVDTVLLIANSPLEKVQKVALDEHSRTSAVLTRVMFHLSFSENVKYNIHSPDLKTCFEQYDAILVIGDKAFEARNRYSDLNIYDLSAEWFRRTGKPFVHAILAARKELNIPPSLDNILRKTGHASLKNIRQLSDKVAGNYGLTPEQCESYLLNKIRYALDAEALNGMEHFNKLCEEAKLF